MTGMLATQLDTVVQKIFLVVFTHCRSFAHALVSACHA